MRTLLEIRSGVYSNPFQCIGIYKENSDGSFSYKWREKQEDEKIESFYELIADPNKKTATVKRSGSISSEMTFELGKETFGIIETAYGAIRVRMETDYINFPSVMSNAFEISYTLNSGDNELIKNVFSVKRLLQNV